VASVFVRADFDVVAAVQQRAATAAVEAAK
jgi:hypothetical protein